MSDEPIKVCPKCKKRKVDKLISHTSFQLKGGGWYSDLYASAKPGSNAGESSSAGSSSSSGSGSTTTPTGSDSKSAGKGSGKKKGAKAAA